MALGRKVVDEVKSLPGVTSVALASTLPLTFNGNTTWIRFVGRAYNGEHNEVNQRGVSSDYFANLTSETLARPNIHRLGGFDQAEGRRHQSNFSEEVLSR